MNLGIDLDGTITQHPEFFALLTQAFHAAGHKIYIITYRCRSADEIITVNTLRGYGIVYDKLYMAPDFVWIERIPSEVWKRDVAESLKLDVFIDDDPANIQQVSATLKLLVWKD